MHAVQDFAGDSTDQVICVGEISDVRKRAVHVLQVRVSPEAIVRERRVTDCGGPG